MVDWANEITLIPFYCHRFHYLLSSFRPTGTGMSSFQYCSCSDVDKLWNFEESGFKVPGSGFRDYRMITGYRNTGVGV